MLPRYPCQLIASPLIQAALGPRPHSKISLPRLLTCNSEISILTKPLEYHYPHGTFPQRKNCKKVYNLEKWVLNDKLNTYIWRDVHILARLYVHERLKCFRNCKMSTYGESFPFFPPKPLAILLGPALSQEADLHKSTSLALGLPVGLQATGRGRRRGNINRRLKGDQRFLSLAPSLPDASLPIPMFPEQGYSFSQRALDSGNHSFLLSLQA